jgi:hypothetical protein
MLGYINVCGWLPANSHGFLSLAARRSAGPLTAIEWLADGGRLLFRASASGPLLIQRCLYLRMSPP